MATPLQQFPNGCGGCGGACCKARLWGWTPVSDHEWEDWEKRVGVSIAQAERDRRALTERGAAWSAPCPQLTEDGICGIYENAPSGCLDYAIGGEGCLRDRKNAGL